jgi:putative ABC transport system substrate-binding protein
VAALRVADIASNAYAFCWGTMRQKETGRMVRFEHEDMKTRHCARLIADWIAGVGVGPNFIAGLGSAAWPMVARAQQQAWPVVGFLSVAAPGFGTAAAARPFRQGLSQMGFVEGRNVTFEYRVADGVYGRLPAMAADLVRRQVALIFASGSHNATLAAKAAPVP